MAVFYKIPPKGYKKAPEFPQRLSLTNETN